MAVCDLIQSLKTTRPLGPTDLSLVSFHFVLSISPKTDFLWKLAPEFSIFVVVTKWQSHMTVTCHYSMAEKRNQKHTSLSQFFTADTSCTLADSSGEMEVSSLTVILARMTSLMLCNNTALFWPDKLITRSTLRGKWKIYPSKWSNYGNEVTHKLAICPKLETGRLNWNVAM